MGNAPSGTRLGSDASAVKVDDKVFTLQVENSAGLEFNLVSFDPPELGNFLPKKFEFQCSLELGLDRLSAGCLAVYSTAVKVGAGSRGAKYDVIGKKQGQETTVATAFDQRDSKAGQFFSLYAAVSKGWFLSSSVPVVAASLASGYPTGRSSSSGEYSDTLHSLKHAASDEGQNGCCSWLVYSTPGEEGSFSADVRILKTSSHTMQGRADFLDSLQSRGSAASNQSRGLLGACQRRVSSQDANTRSASVAAGAHDSGCSAQSEGKEAASKDALLEPEPPASPATASLLAPEPAEPSPASVQQDITEAGDGVVATSAAMVTSCKREHSQCDSAGLESRADDEQTSQCNAQLESRAGGASSNAACDNLVANGSMFTPAKRQAPAAETTTGESTDAPMHVQDVGSSSSSVTRAERLLTKSTHLVAEASSGSAPSLAVADARSSDCAVPVSKMKPAQGAGGSTIGLDGKLRGNKSGSIALQAKKEQEQRKKEEELRKKEEEQKKLEEEQERAMRATDGLVIATQDAEFELGLLHDQVKRLQQERTSLRKQVNQWEVSLETVSQLRQNAEMRLERYGENPKIRAEADKAAREEAEIEAEITQPLAEAKERLFVVEAEAAEKEELLTIAALAEDDM